MKKWKWTWVFLAVAMYLCNDVSMRLVVVDINFIAGCIVQVIPLIIISASGLLYEKNRVPVGENRSTNLRLIPLYGTVQVLFGNVFYFLSMSFGGLSIASPTVQSQAVWAVVLGCLILGEQISYNRWMGVAGFVVGISLITYFKSQGTVIPNWHWGILFGILGGLSWASGSTVQKILLKDNVSNNAILFFGTLTGAILLTILGLITNADSFIKDMISADTYKMLLPGFFSSVATWCLTFALKKISVSVVIPILSVNIIFNTVIGAVFWKEYVNTGTIAGLLIAFTGILISQDFKLAKDLRKERI